MWGQFSEKFSVPAEMEQIAVAIDHLRETLSKINVKRQEITKFCLRAEEVLALLIKNADGKSPVTISVSSLFGSSKVKMNCSGVAFTVDDLDTHLLETTEDAEAKIALQNLLSRVITKQIQVQYRQGVSICTLNVQESSAKSVYNLLMAMLAGLVFGFVLNNFCPAGVTAYILKNIIDPIGVIFINVLKTIIAPLVFFSIANSVAGFTDLRALGRIASKTLGLYLFTSVVAVLAGYFAFHILPSGAPSLQSAIAAHPSDLAPAESVGVSLGQSLIGLFPSNFIAPFLKMEMLQIIFLGLLIGIACSKMQKKDNLLVKIIDNCNSLLTAVVSIIVSSMPLVVFSFMCKIVCATELAGAANLVTFILSDLLKIFLLLCFYSFLLLLVHYSPVEFFRKFTPAIITAFTTSSSNATIPVSLKACTERIGIHPKIASFSIPLGATVNMDASCGFMVMSIFFVARIYNIEIPVEQYFSLGLTIYMLSVGVPGVYGGSLVYIAAILPTIGAPSEAVSLLIIINTFTDRFNTAGNVIGDAAVSTVVALTEGLLDRSLK